MNKDKLQQELAEAEQMQQQAIDRITAIKEQLKAPELYECLSGGYWIDSIGKVDSGNSLRSYAEFGVEAETREQAELKAKMMLPQHILIDYFVRYCPDYDPDWSDGSVEKWCVRPGKTAYITEPTWLNPYIGTIYFPKEIAQQLCDDLNAGRIPQLEVK